MDVLNRYRSWLIQKGRRVGKQIAEAEGEVHSRQVREAIWADLAPEARGKIRQSGLKDFWLGAVFNHPMWVWTGRWYKYTDSRRNIHERTIKVWRLR